MILANLVLMVFLLIMIVTVINIATPACPNEFHSHEDIEWLPACPHTDHYQMDWRGHTVPTHVMESEVILHNTSPDLRLIDR